MCNWEDNSEGEKRQGGQLHSKIERISGESLGPSHQPSQRHPSNVREVWKDTQAEVNAVPDKNFRPTNMPAIALYCKTERAEPMANLWADFISATQSAREHIGVEALALF